MCDYWLYDCPKERKDKRKDGIRVLREESGGWVRGLREWLGD